MRRYARPSALKAPRRNTSTISRLNRRNDGYRRRLEKGGSEGRTSMLGFSLQGKKGLFQERGACMKPMKETIIYLH